MARPSPQESEKICTSTGSLKIGILKSIHMPEIKHKRTVPPAMQTAQTQSEGKALTESRDIREEIVHSSGRVS